MAATTITSSETTDLWRVSCFFHCTHSNFPQKICNFIHSATNSPCHLFEFWIAKSCSICIWKLCIANRHWCCLVRCRSYDVCLCFRLNFHIDHMCLHFVMRWWHPETSSSQCFLFTVLLFSSSLQCPTPFFAADSTVLLSIHQQLVMYMIYVEFLLFLY